MHVMSYQNNDNEATVLADIVEHVERDSSETVTVYLNNGLYIVLSQDDIDRLTTA